MGSNSLRELVANRKEKVGSKPTKEEIEFSKLPASLQKQAMRYIKKWTKGVLE